jgi:hypothetical protein
MPIKKYSQYINEEFSNFSTVPKHINDLSDESSMAIGQLKTIIDHASELIYIIANINDLPEWVQNKLTLSTDYVEKVHSYLNSKHGFKNSNPK